MTQTKVSLRLLRFHAQDGDVRVFRRFSVDEQIFFFLENIRKHRCRHAAFLKKRKRRFGIHSDKRGHSPRFGLEGLGKV